MELGGGEGGREKDVQAQVQARPAVSLSGLAQALVLVTMYGKWECVPGGRALEVQVRVGCGCGCMC